MKVYIINGPNLNLTGIREQGVYGNESFEDFLPKLKSQFKDLQIDYFQCNHEGMIIDKLQETGFSYDLIILNAGALSHTSIAIADAISSITTPVIEVHMSNIYAREIFRHHSYLSSRCKGVICGFGLNSYKLALEMAKNLSS